VIIIRCEGEETPADPDLKVALFLFPVPDMAAITEPAGNSPIDIKK
jgi:hypothetical protein